LVSGRGTIHAELEARLARFEQTEAAILFPSGYAANSGTIAALTGKGDAIFSDAKNHASIIDGCRLSEAETIVYPHCDCDALDELLRTAGEYRRRLIVTDTLFSMDGDLAPIDRIADLAAEHNAMVMVDEAHATGVFGAQGRGVVESVSDATGRTDLDELVHIRVGTLSKALGSGGGFVAGRQSLVDWLANRARSYVFSTAQPVATSAAALAALDIVEHHAEPRRLLRQRADRLRERLVELGWNTGRSASQVIPIYVGRPEPTMQLADRLRKAGFFVPGIRPPSVPPGESLLRLSLCANHADAMVEGLLEALGGAV
jgi:8-amino-7-oxononanoate synthase